MSIASPSPRLLPALSRRGITGLSVLSGFFVVAFLLAPNALARTSVNTENVARVFRGGFVTYWRSGDSRFTGDLDGAVTYWFHYHLVKAAVSVLLLLSLGLLSAVLWNAFRRSGGRVRAASATGTGLLALVALVAAMANVQGAAAPFASLLPMLTSGSPRGELAATLAQVQQRLHDDPGAYGRTSQPLDAMVSQFAVYHAVLAALAAAVALAFLAASVPAWRTLRRSAPADRRVRRMAAWLGGSSVVLAFTFAVLVFANAKNALDSTGALTAFFGGPW
ncbi:hypothetical protein [Streptomyces sp. PsTaAH-124]|uniref:hypothetical protein n=1 Tax=Streptomyces sp. PsTaAH-124 TaxID=1157638 RepID=UPI0003805A41|nr:hypothetical protein [Streptomyces sp. PsTaAH-124]